MQHSLTSKWLQPFHLSFPGAEKIDVSLYAQLPFVELGLM